MAVWTRGKALPGINILTPHGFELPGRVMTEPDVRRAAEWGMRTIRAGFTSLEMPNSPYEYDEEGFAKVDLCLDWCQRYDLRCLLCLWDTDTDWWGTARCVGRIWKEKELQKRVCELWATVAERYRGRPETLAFELVNEPRAARHEDWNLLAGRMHRAIRDVDRTHTILVESNRWGSPQAFSSLKTTGDPNTVYSFHFYEPLIFTNQGAPWMVTFSQFYHETVPYPGEAPRLDEYIQRLPSWADDVVRQDLDRSRGQWNRERLAHVLQPVLEFRQRHNADVFCSEFGVNKRAPRTGVLNWLRDVVALFRKQKIGWTYWYYRDLDFGILDSHNLDHTEPPEYLDEELLVLLLT